MTSPRQLLDKARTILLVDWPSTTVPRALLEARLSVFGFAPGGYSRAELADAPPPPRDGVRSFPPGPGEYGHIVFRRLDRSPDQVDVVYIHRPAAELTGILITHARPLGATVLWLQPPLDTREARWLTEAGGPVVVEGVDIVDAVRSLGR